VSGRLAGLCLGGVVVDPFFRSPRSRGSHLRHSTQTRVQGCVFATSPDVADLDALYVAFHCDDPIGYTTSIDMRSALHPQTVLCLTYAGKPLEPKFGVPMRVKIPTKLYRKALEIIRTHAELYDPDFAEVFVELIANLDPPTTAPLPDRRARDPQGR
jgi:hypothetical protein